jgi:signal transduction histidine kinase/ActR/RegA family two-component response regulator
LTIPDVLPHERVLVLAPLGRDAALLCEVLRRAGLTAVACDGMSALVSHLEGGAGAALVTQEALAPAAMSDLLKALSTRPEWDDLPIVLLASDERLADAQAIAALRSAGNLTVLERPVRGVTLVTAIQSALRDRRRQYEIEALLQRERAARREAEQASRVKDEFLATVSHELRTPLSAVLLWSRILRRGPLDDEKTRHALEAIERSAEMQSKLIEDLLDVARMTSGKLNLELQPVDLGPLVQASLDIVRPSAEAKGISLHADIDPRAGLVRADANRMQQVIWNLLSNAVKFTPPGGQVHARLVRRGDHAHVEIVDTGKGIDHEFLPHVFERFRQADASPQRLQSGLGLGLAISRQLIELHGGTIQAHSGGEGLGSTFLLEVPLLNAFADASLEPAAPGAADSVASTAAAGPLEGIRVLLVEDDLGMQEAMGFALGQYGAEVTAVGSAPEALEILEADPARGGLDVVLSDFSLPGMDGYELLRQIRAMAGARSAPALPVALITAYARPEDRIRALAAGFSGYLAKPMEPAQLLTIVVQLLGRDSHPLDHPRLEER